MCAFPSDIFPFRILGVDRCKTQRLHLKMGSDSRILNAALFNSPVPHRQGGCNYFLYYCDVLRSWKTFLTGERLPLWG